MGTNMSFDYPGARWWKFDFHTHTPASKDTRAWQAVLGTSEELTAETWLLKYMAAEIDCVAITDHNSGEWIDKLKAAYAAMREAAAQGSPPDGFRELHLFPGVEISVQGGFHLLAIFDPTKSSHTINDLLSRVDYDGTQGDSDGVTREGAANVVEKILALGGIPIPAHTDKDKGLLQVQPGTLACKLDPNTVKQVLQVTGILALERCDMSAQLPSAIEDMKFVFASVIGSDCHSFQGTAVPGSRYTWIKMAAPSLEGLRLALLDGQGVSVRRSDDGDIFTPFDKPEHFIESIEIKNAKFMGRGTPLKLKLNPYFNAIIGGRGTGKSTVVHALRLAYRRDAELPDKSEAKQTFSQFNKVSRHRNDEGALLSDTQVSVQVSRDNAPHRLLWRNDEKGHVVEDQDEVIGCFKAADSQIVNEQRFPIRLFSQGQIAALSGDSQEALLKVIDDAAGTITQQSAFEDVRRSFFVLLSQLRDLNGKLQGREALNLNLQDVNRKLTKFEGTDHAVVLKNYQRIRQQEQELERQFDSVDELARRLTSFSQQIVIDELPDGLFDDASDNSVLQIMGRLRKQISSARMEVERTAVQLSEQGRLLRSELNTSPWSAQANDIKAAYDKLKEGLQEQGVNDPHEYGRLVQEKQQLEQEAKRLDTVQKERDTLLEEVRENYENVKSARQAISETRQSFLSSALEGNPYVRIGLVPYSRDARAIERSLRDALGVTEGKYIEDIYQEAQGDVDAKGLVADLLLSSNIGEAAEELNTPNFELAIQRIKNRLVKAARENGDFGGWFNKFLKAEAEKRSEYTDHILCWFPEDGLKVEYSRKGDGRDFQSIGQASAGQRAAAMLAFLLAHGREPLVLDQPEDDLDNHLIYDLVVQQIRSNKLHRQLIIVTHNPNIVVNGDAELIHALDFNGQCLIKHLGSLQNQQVRDEVCQVMEGGKEAFNRRYQRLGRSV